MKVEWGSLLAKAQKKLHRRTPLYVLGLPISIIYLIMLGCMSTTGGLSSVHLVRINGLESPNAINIGFFGLCAMKEDGGAVACSKSRFETPSKELKAAVSGPLLELAVDLQKNTFVPMLLGTITIFVLATLTFLGVKLLMTWKSKTGVYWDKTLEWMVILLWIATATAVAMALGVDMAAGGMAGVGAKGDVKVQEGWTVVVLLIVVVVMSSFFNAGLWWSLFDMRMKGKGVE